jgi:hypothetical protein
MRFTDMITDRFSAPGPFMLKWKTTPAWKAIRAVSDSMVVNGQFRSDLQKRRCSKGSHEILNKLAVEDDSQKKMTKTISFQLPAGMGEEVKAE